MNTPDQNSIIYTSPHTNKTYTIVKSTSERSAWDDHGNYTPVTFDQFNIYDDDHIVQFAFDEEGIARAVNHYELPGPDVSSRFD